MIHIGLNIKKALIITHSFIETSLSSKFIIDEQDDKIIITRMKKHEIKRNEARI